MPTFSQGIAKKAQEQPKHRFGNLYELLNEAYLQENWREIRKDAAVERLTRKQYRAKLVRRRYIPKGDGKLRPLGIPAFEDKLLQLAVTRILQAIYEQDFLRCSYGYRPNVGALDAVDWLTVKLQFGRYNFVVEADIKEFFDNIEHDWMMRMLGERIEDGAFLRLVKKWHKAGVVDTDATNAARTTGHVKANASRKRPARTRSRPIGDRPAGRPRTIFHDTRWSVDGMRKCPHGVVHGMKCAICDPEGSKLGE